MGFANGTSVSFLPFHIILASVIPTHFFREPKKMKSNFLPRHHTVQQVAALLQQSGWECLEHLLYSPDFAPADFIAVINTNVSSINKFY